MNCNGKIYPFRKSCNFELMIFGDQNKGKVSVEGAWQEKQKSWLLTKIDVLTKDENVTIL